MDEGIPNATFPEDAERPENARASTSKVVRLTKETATREYVDERFAAISTLMRTSMEPALALMPIAKRREIRAAFDGFEALVADEG